jgi:hypothetical protein
MNFFDEVDSLGIAERHANRVLKLEESSGKSLISDYKAIRQELRDRLTMTPNDTFTAQKLRGVLLQVELAIEAQGRALKSGMKDSASDFASLGVDHLLSEIRKFQDEFSGAVMPINLNAAAIADDASQLLVNQYDASIDAYSSAQRGAIGSSLTQSVIAEDGLYEVVGRLSQYMMAEEWKVLRLARTELHNVYSLGKLTGMRELQSGDVPDLKKALYHPMDSRTGKDSVYAQTLNQIVPIDEPFSYRWGGKIRTYMTPPDRPNDRSILIPYRDSWAK